MQGIIFYTSMRLPLTACRGAIGAIGAAMAPSPVPIYLYVGERPWRRPAYQINTNDGAGDGARRSGAHVFYFFFFLHRIETV